MTLQLPEPFVDNAQQQANNEEIAKAMPTPGTFLRLASVGNVAIAFSAAPVVVAVAAGIGVAVVTHGLGTTPRAVMLAGVNVGVGGIDILHDTVGLTTFRIVVYGPGAYNQPVSWIVVG